MARRTPPKEPTPAPELAVPYEEASKKIAERIVLGKELLARNISTVEELSAVEKDFSRWSSYNNEMLGRLFTTPKFAEEYSYWGVMAVSLSPRSPAEQLKEHQKEVQLKIHRLESIQERLELIPIASGVETATRPDLGRKRTNKVFIVHGHDEGARESVARFLERLDLDTVILHEQASSGRTVVEKLEHYADVDFAVVLLTPDDVGGAKGGPPDKLQARARQNVVLELGYFAGKLGRKHVCALYRGPLELPSDYMGVVYVALDDGGGWRLQLAKELRVAGFDVDLNRAV